MLMKKFSERSSGETKFRMLRTDVHKEGFKFYTMVHYLSSDIFLLAYDEDCENFVGLPNPKSDIGSSIDLIEQQQIKTWPRP